MTEGWLKHVQEAAEEVPTWILKTLRHPRFVSVSRELEDDADQEFEYWWIITRDEIEFSADTLREVCQKFLDHYSR